MAGLTAVWNLVQVAGRRLVGLISRLSPLVGSWPAFRSPVLEPRPIWKLAHPKVPHGSDTEAFTRQAVGGEHGERHTAYL